MRRSGGTRIAPAPHVASEFRCSKAGAMRYTQRPSTEVIGSFGSQPWTAWSLNLPLRQRWPFAQQPAASADRKAMPQHRGDVPEHGRIACDNRHTKVAFEPFQHMQRVQRCALKVDGVYVRSVSERIDRQLIHLFRALSLGSGHVLAASVNSIRHRGGNVESLRSDELFEQRV